MSPKKWAAFSSLLVAILLTVLKIVVGIATNSLAIISEALHSGIDLIAAAMTLFAVTKSDNPPDSGHMYGHYKIENISSLIETILLYVTAIWVLYEAIDRLLVGAVVEINIFAILVMAFSAIINYGRSRYLYRAANKYKSQALEADAVHFQADLITSIVVIVGIIPAYFGFSNFDSYAAIIVALIIGILGYRIGKKSILSLMDTAPPGMEKLICDEAQKVKGVEKVGRIRVRESGPRTFIDLTIFIDKVLPLEIAHGVTEEVTKVIQAKIPHSDVMVHAEPLAANGANLVGKIRSEASNFPEIKNIHNIRVFEIDSKLHIDFHIEVEGYLPISTAHQIADQLERRIKLLDSSIENVSCHAEPIDGGVTNGNRDLESYDRLRKVIEAILESHTEIQSYKALEIKNIDNKLNVNMDIIFKEDITVQEAHHVADQLEAEIKAKLTEIDNISIHLEPS